MYLQSKKTITTGIYFILFLLSPSIFGQQNFGGGKYETEKVPCLTEKQSEWIISELKASSKMLEAQGMIPEINLLSEVKFIWPVRLNTNFKDPSFYGISNYVDNNPEVTNKLLDYNCGARTYDLSSGYNHRGIDIFSWPLPHWRQELNAVEIVAAAPGIILNKIDGNPDKNCAFCSNCNWNAVYVLQANGSVAWYGHLKNGSLTPKPIGASVQAGEYLGVMASSGSSTGPHLHFEVWADQSYSQLIDPFAGPCNSFNGNTSWWENQRPYRRAALNKIMTGHAAYVSGNCPNLETPNDRNVFAPGALIYFTNFFQDQTVGLQTQFKIIQPNGTVWQNWSQQSPNTYSASWWWWSWILPNNITGYWVYEVTIPSTGQIVRHTFFVGNAPPVTTLKPGAFNDPTVWSNGVVPGPNDPVFVCHPISVSTNRTIQSLMVNEGGQVIVPNGISFMVGNVGLQEMHSRMKD